MDEIAKKIKSDEKLATRVLRSMSIRVSLIVLMSSILSYLHFYSNIEESAINTLKEYVSERTHREAFIFEQARSSHTFLKKKIETYLTSSKYLSKVENSAFNKYLELKKDGTYRNTQGYDGRKMAGVFIPPGFELNNQKKNLIMFLKETAENFGPAFRGNFQDTYFTTPENVMVIYWPEVPNWTMEMDASFDMTKEEYVWIADEKNNPDRKMVWTGLFYDKVGKIWMTSAETPIYMEDKHMLTIGHDIVLQELLDRATKDSLPGAYNVIFRDDGRLIIHPNKVQELKDHSGYYDINKTDDLFLKGLKESILNAKPGATVVEHSDGESLLAFEKIKGPNWFFVVVYPRSLITSSALQGILFVIILAIASLILEVLLIWLVLKKEVNKPIEQLYLAAENVANGDFQTKVAINRKDELGSFAEAFNTMAAAIKQRDKELQNYADSLEKKVEERTAELDKQRALAVESSKMASLGEMAGGIAHEINNPLAIISLATDNISRAVENENYDKEIFENSCSKIEKTVKRINKIITGLRTISRSEANTEPEPEKLNEILEDVMGLCSEKMRMNGVSLEVKGEKELQNSMVLCLRIQLSQVLLNLLNNANDAVSEQEKKWISITLEKNKEMMMIKVIDSGKGVDKKLANKIFQPFYTTKAIGKGTGLGLSLSNSLMEQQNGKLYIDHSSENTCFVVEVPLA